MKYVAKSGNTCKVDVMEGHVNANWENGCTAEDWREVKEWIAENYPDWVTMRYESREKTLEL